MSERTKLPADVELEDRLAFGLTARQLAILAATAIAAYLAFTAISSLAPPAVAAALATPIGIVGVLLALGRRDGLSGDQLALLAARHLSRPRRRITAPEGVPTARRGLGALEPPVRAVLRSGLIERDDGSFCLLLAAGGTTFQLRNDEEQAGLLEAFGRFLNGLTEPVQIAVRGEPLDLRTRAEGLERTAGSLACPTLAEAARGHAGFLKQLGSGERVRRREILLVLSTHARDRQTAGATLERRAEEAAELLGGAGVTLRRLDGEQAASVLARSLDPPCPPAGVRLEGVVRAC